jgi:hypothetical protein
MTKVGVEEGDACNRGDCSGNMFLDKVQGCTCFINPPCSACVDNPLVCDTCFAEVEDGDFE